MRAFLFGYAVGLAQLGAILGIDGSPTGWSASVDQIARLAMTLGHIGLFLTLWRCDRARLAMAPLARTGRMTEKISELAFGQRLHRKF